MSACIVEEITIHRIATLLAAVEPDLAADPVALGNTLWRMNLDAVNSRYATRAAAPTYAAFELSTDALPQLAKSLQYYLYQCAEGDVPDRPLFLRLHAVACRMIDLVQAQDTFAYHVAEWR